MRIDGVRLKIQLVINYYLKNLLLKEKSGDCSSKSRLRKWHLSRWVKNHVTFTKPSWAQNFVWVCWLQYQRFVWMIRCIAIFRNTNCSIFNKKKTLKYWKIKSQSQRENLEARMLTLFAIEICSITPLESVYRSRTASVCSEGDLGLACQILLRDLL